MISKHQTLGNIVAIIPSAAPFFEMHQIDYCCQGNRTLHDALKHHTLNIDDVLNILNDKLSQTNTATPWMEADLNSLVDHILDTHHAYLYEKLPFLSELTTKILRVHGLHHQELKEVHTWFHRLKPEMEAHLIKEETLQYPAIREYLKTKNQEKLQVAKDVIQSLEDEHRFVGDALKELRKVTNNYALPHDACQTYEKTYEFLEELEKNTFQHIHLENNILFKRLLEL